MYKKLIIQYHVPPELIDDFIGLIGTNDFAPSPSRAAKAILIKWIHAKKEKKLLENTDKTISTNKPIVAPKPIVPSTHEELEKQVSDWDENG